MKANQQLFTAAFFTPRGHGRENEKSQRWGLPLMEWGPPGTGKSAGKTQLAHRLQLGECFDILSPAERGEAAFGVVPVPTKAGTICYPPPDWAAKYAGKRGLVFVDEINLAPPHYQGPILGLLLDGRVGACYLGDGVRFCGAANPTGQSAGGWDLPLPTANRMGHLDVTVDGTEWVGWLVGGANGDGGGAPIDCAAEEARVLSLWPDAFATARGVIAGFISARGDLLFQLPAVGSERAQKAWPSPRTWEFATRALASATIQGMSEIAEHAFLSCFVGSAAIVEFVAWRRMADLPQPRDVLDGKVEWKHNGKRLDVTLTVLSGCAALLCSTTDNHLARLDRMWKLISDTATAGAADVCIPAAKALVSAKLFKATDSIKTFAALRPIMAAAGLIQ